MPGFVGRRLDGIVLREASGSRFQDVKEFLGGQRAHTRTLQVDERVPTVCGVEHADSGAGTESTLPTRVARRLCLEFLA